MLLCVCAAAYLGSAARQERAADRAESSLDAGRVQRAQEQARKVDGSWLQARTARLQARAALALGDLPAAEAFVTQAVRRMPQDWSLHRDRAVLLLRLGRRAGARVAIGRALALNPRLVLPPGFAASTSDQP